MSLQTETRRITAILATDMVEYSRLMEVDERDVIARQKSHRDELIDPAISEHHGRIVKTTGDGLLLEFASVVNAVECAAEIQRAMPGREAAQPKDRRIQYRMGINLGDIVIEGDDIFGDGVNVASRLEGLADPDGILISGTAFDQLKQKIDVGYEYLGEQQVRNIAQPVRAYRVLLAPEAAGQIITKKRPAGRLVAYAAIAAALLIFAAGGLYAWQPWVKKVAPAAISRMAHSLPDKPSVAVLPFDNMSGDKQQDYFADGMVEDLITDLSKLSGLFVISRNSTFTYKGKAVKVQKVAEELGVRYVIEGSVRRAGDKLRINVQLIDAISGRHVWAERYDGTMADVFGLQDTITAKIVTALAVKLVSGKVNNAHGTDNPAAYDAVLRGWGYLRLTRNDPKNYPLARQQFEKALNLDPDYGRAHLSMAAVLWWSARSGQYFRLGVDDYEKILALAKFHLKIAMNKPTALGHRIRAEMYRDDAGQFDKAIAEAQRAVSLDPNNPEGYAALASAQISAGLSKKAVDNIMIADRLDPENLRPNWSRHGRVNLLLGNYAKAARYFELSVDAQPSSAWAYLWLTATYGHLGKLAEAKKAIEKMNQIRAANGYGSITLAFATGFINLKQEKDRAIVLQGLEKAGLATGGDVKATKQALDSIISRTDEGHYKIKGATVINAKQAKGLLDQGAIIFDMLPTRKWRAGHVKGALHAKSVVGDFTADNLRKFVRKDQSVVFYCSGFT